MKKNVCLFTLSESPIRATAQLIETERLSALDACMLQGSINQSTAIEIEGVDINEINIAELDKNVLFSIETDDDTTNEDSNFVKFIRRIGFRKCDTCGAWITPQDIQNGVSVYTNCHRYCATCYANLQNANVPQFKAITPKGYHGTNEPFEVLQTNGEHYTIENVKGFGFELEIDSHDRMLHNGKIMVTPDFYKLARPRGATKVLRFEHDGSLDNGFEIISNIMTYDYLANFDFETLCAECRRLGADDTLTTSGLHLHVSKLWLGDDEREQAINTMKLYCILNAYEDDFFKMSGRRSRTDRSMYYCRFLGNSGTEDILNTIKGAINRGAQYLFSYLPSGHDTALINSGKTIEFRFMKSTTNPTELRNRLLLIANLVRNIKNVPFEKIYCLKRIFKLVPSEIMSYWRYLGVFKSTIATDKKGETF